MTVHGLKAHRRKSLGDYHNLSRVPEASFVRKRLHAASSGDSPTPRSVFQKLKAFASSDAWGWFIEYISHRFGPRHEFRTYDSPQDDNGVYPLEGDDETEGSTIRISVAGDWATGTDEAFAVAELIKKRNPYYTIHLGDVYFVGDAAEAKENFLGEKIPAMITRRAVGREAQRARSRSTAIMKCTREATPISTSCCQHWA